MNRRKARMRTFGLWLAVSISLVLCACATPKAVRRSPQSGCDAAIDAAVHKGDWQTALLDHQRFVTDFPGDCLALYHLGYIWGQLGDRPQELQFYEKAVACGYDGDDRLYFNMGMAMASLGELEGARSALAKAIATNPGNADNHYGMGLMAQALDQPDQAELFWCKGVALNDGHVEAHLALVHLFLDQSRWEEARSHLDRVQAVAPDNEEARALREILRSRQALEY